MSIFERIHLLRQAVASSHSNADWSQRSLYPDESIGCDWGPSEIVASKKENKSQFEEIGKYSDSGNLFLVLAMRRHLEPLMDEVERLHEELRNLKSMKELENRDEQLQNDLDSL